jgi:hypothetical protein
VEFEVADEIDCGIEIKPTRECFDDDCFWRCEENARCGITVQSTSEVAIVRGNDRVLRSLMFISMDSF